jgi:hypothetical protein
MAERTGWGDRRGCDRMAKRTSTHAGLFCVRDTIWQMSSRSSTPAAVVFGIATCFNGCGFSNRSSKRAQAEVRNRTEGAAALRRDVMAMQ